MRADGSRLLLTGVILVLGLPACVAPRGMESVVRHAVLKTNWASTFELVPIRGGWSWRAKSGEQLTYWRCERFGLAAGCCRRVETAADAEAWVWTTLRHPGGTSPRRRSVNDEPSHPQTSTENDLSDLDRDYWDRHAKNYDRSMSLLGGPIPRMVGLVGAATAGLERVLEVAAGTGLVTTIAAGAREVIATDYAAAMVTSLQRRVRNAGVTNVLCERADLYALRFEDGSFDAVVATNVLHLVPDLPRGLAALRRVLKPGGRLIVPTFCHDEDWLSRVVSRVLAVTGFPGHRRFTVKSLQRAVEEAGVLVSQAVLIPGLIPIGYVEGRFE